MGRLPTPADRGGEDRYAVLLERLPVVLRPARDPGYRRAVYGPAWAYTDHSGCWQRQDALFRDLDRAWPFDVRWREKLPARGDAGTWTATPTPVIGDPSRT